MLKACSLFAAYAEAAAEGAADAPEKVGFFQQYGMTIILIVAMVAVFYFLILRPQKKRDKEARDMRDSIKVGDEVITIGGIVGKVCNVKEDRITIITSESKMVFLKTAISSVSSPESELEQ
ncbi:MAG: preprotein translocase subunit YajC [Ruminococcaceae bacterium]|nr:preprotein translocase subunit YajC [Oscillospiraceae bacterium]